jgi:L-histidine N-alpha-methyltransferase
MPPALTPEFLQITPPRAESLRDELQRGLLAEPPYIAPKYFYDALGSALFAAITELPEYYPTRTEAAIFGMHADHMARFCGRGLTLVDLGAGNCAKAAALFAALQPHRYVAVDISADFLRRALGELQLRHPALPMLGLGLDFSSSLELPPQAGDEPRLMFYPGSSIGNFTPAEAQAFLRRARAAAPGGALLIGVDLVKPTALLQQAYDDALGVTAAFNLNLLRHVNHLLGSDFDIGQWRHLAFFDNALSRIEMHLEARRDLRVSWPGGSLALRAGERIHTENSYKYRAEDFEALLRGAGYEQQCCWTDPRRWFAVFAAR